MGFWDFITEVVLDRRAAAEAAAAPAPPANLPSVVLVEADRCTTLALDRRSNVTMALPCANNGLALRLVPETGTREDLAALSELQLQGASYRPD